MRFFKPSTSQYVTAYTPIPIDYLTQVTGNKQALFDKNNLLLDSLTGLYKDVKALPVDVPYKNKIIADMEKDVEDLQNQIANNINGDIADATPAIIKLNKKFEGLTKEGGALYNIQNAYNKYETLSKEAKDLQKETGVSMKFYPEISYQAYMESGGAEKSNSFDEVEIPVFDKKTLDAVEGFLKDVQSDTWTNLGKYKMLFGNQINQIYEVVDGKITETSKKKIIDAMYNKFQYDPQLQNYFSYVGHKGAYDAGALKAGLEKFNQYAKQVASNSYGSIINAAIARTGRKEELDRKTVNYTNDEAKAYMNYELDMKKERWKAAQRKQELNDAVSKIVEAILPPTIVPEELEQDKEGFDKGKLKDQITGEFTLLQNDKNFNQQIETLYNNFVKTNGRKPVVKEIMSLTSSLSPEKAAYARAVVASKNSGISPSLTTYSMTRSGSRISQFNKDGGIDATDATDILKSQTLPSNSLSYTRSQASVAEAKKKLASGLRVESAQFGTFGQNSINYKFSDGSTATVYINGIADNSLKSIGIETSIKGDKYIGSRNELPKNAEILMGSNGTTIGSPYVVMNTSATKVQSFIKENEAVFGDGLSEKQREQMAKGNLVVYPGVGAGVQYLDEDGKKQFTKTTSSNLGLLGESIKNPERATRSVFPQNKFIITGRDGDPITYYRLENGEYNIDHGSKRYTYARDSNDPNYGALKTVLNQATTTKMLGGSALGNPQTGASIQHLYNITQQ